MFQWIYNNMWHIYLITSFIFIALAILGGTIGGRRK